MRRDQHQNRDSGDPSGCGDVVTLHRSRPHDAEDVLKTADPDSAAVDGTQACFVEQRHHVARIDVAMAVEVPQEAALVQRLRKIDDKHAASRLEHAADLARALLAHFARQVMEHQRAQHRIEPSVGERQGLGDGVIESHVYSSPCRLPRCSRDHLGRRVDAEDLARRADLALRGKAKASRSAPYIQYRLTR